MNSEMSALVSSFNVLAISAAILSVLLVKKYIAWRKYVNQINRIPGPKHIWPIGVLLPFILAKGEDYLEVYNTLIDTYVNATNASLVRVWAVNIPFIMFTKATSAEVLLKSSTTVTKADEYKYMKPILGDGLITSSGSLWRAHRKLITPSFHFIILEKFIHVFNEQSLVLLNQLAPMSNKGSFDICPYVNHFTLDSICESAMGVQIHTQTKRDSQYGHALEKFTDVVFTQFIYVWRRVPAIFFFFRDKWQFDRSVKLINDLTNKVIAAKQAERANKKDAPLVDQNANNDYVFGQKKRTAFLDSLLDTIESGENHLTNKELSNEVATFIAAGYETTSSGICLTILNFALYPEVQDMAYQEINSIFGDSDRPVEVSDLAKMKYLQAVMKEVFRLHPPVPIVARKLEEDLLVDGFTVPKNVTVVVNVRTVHRDPSIYKNPEDFDPNRFLKKNVDENKHPYGFIPFSAGPRNCIGQKFGQMELMVVLCHILRNFSFSGTWTVKDAKMSMGIVSKPNKGVQVTMTKRERY